MATPLSPDDRANAAEVSGRARPVLALGMWIVRAGARYAFRTAMRHVVAGRYIDRSRPERGRFSPHDVDLLLKDTYRYRAELVPKAQLSQYRRLGNRQNVYLSVLTISAYRAFRAAGIDRDYAVELIADAGWKVYRAGVVVPRMVSRLVARDPQRRLNFILRTWLAYPFQTPGRADLPGYQVTAWAGPDRFYTHWTACPPYACVETLGTPEEREAFSRIWCLYDFAIAREMVPGGRFKRAHCLSQGDGVCDMEWLVATDIRRPGVFLV